jgi:hypothetical protein
MEAYLLLALFVCVIGLASLIAVAITLAERVRHLEWINAKLKAAIKPWDHDGDGYPGGRAPNIDPYVKRAVDRANAS